MGMLASSSTCEDMPSWNNGYSKCGDESFGYWPYCVPGQGWTCEGYEKKGWCKWDRCLSADWTGGVYACGDKLNYPERACCACGGGYQSQHHSVTTSAPQIRTGNRTGDATTPSMIANAR